MKRAALAMALWLALPLPVAGDTGAFAPAPGAGARTWARLGSVPRAHGSAVNLGSVWAPAGQRGLAPGAMLVASRELLDPNFSRTIILLIQYTAEGALGVIINRPTEVPIGAVLTDIADLVHRGESIYIGGPVGLNTVRVLVRTPDALTGLTGIVDGLYYLETLEELQGVLGQTSVEPDLRFYAGYAGWAPGQLELEVLRGDWYLLEAETDALFAPDPGSLWQNAIDRLSGNWVSR